MKIIVVYITDTKSWYGGFRIIAEGNIYKPLGGVGDKLFNEEPLRDDFNLKERIYLELSDDNFKLKKLRELNNIICEISWCSLNVYRYFSQYSKLYKLTSWLFILFPLMNFLSLCLMFKKLPYIPSLRRVRFWSKTIFGSLEVLVLSIIILRMLITLLPL